MECSYDKLIQEIGPLCPLFYSKPIIINFLIFIDDDLRIKVQNYEYVNHDEKEEKEDKDEKEEKDENIKEKEEKKENKE